MRDTVDAGHAGARREFAVAQPAVLRREGAQQRERPRERRHHRRARGPRARAAGVDLGGHGNACNDAPVRRRRQRSTPGSSVLRNARARTRLPVGPRVRNARTPPVDERGPAPSMAAMIRDQETLNVLLDNVARFVRERLIPNEAARRRDRRDPGRHRRGDEGAGPLRPVHPGGVRRARAHDGGGSPGRASSWAAPRPRSARSSAPTSASARRASSSTAPRSRSSSTCRGSPPARSSPRSR